MAQRTVVLARGRAAYERASWTAALEALREADSIEPLPVEDVERLATAAYVLGRLGESEALLERAYQERAASGQTLAALRDAFWLGITSSTRARSRAAPVVRVKRADLAAAGGDHIAARVSDVEDGKPLLEDGRVLDVADALWCTGFGEDVDSIRIPVTGEDGWPDRPADRAASRRRGRALRSEGRQGALGLAAEARRPTRDPRRAAWQAALPDLGRPSGRRLLGRIPSRSAFEVARAGSGSCAPRSPVPGPGLSPRARAR